MIDPVNAFTNAATFRSNPSGNRLLLLFEDELNPLIFSNRFTDSDGNSKLLKLLFSVNGFPPLRFSNSCHPELLVLVLCPNIPNSVF